MKKALIIIIFIGAMFLIVFCGVSFYSIRQGLLRMKTDDTIARISMCVFSLLEENKTVSPEYIILEMKHQFPDETYVGNQVLDAWGQPLQIHWHENEDAFEITIRSARRSDGDFSKNQGVRRYQQGIRKGGRIEWESPCYNH